MWLSDVLAILIRILAAIGGFLASLFGKWDSGLTCLVIMMVLDYLSGVIVAALGKSDKSENGKLNSNAGAKGLLKKGMMLLVLLVAALADDVMGTQNAMFRTAVCWFYIANEGLSVLENATRAGVPWPGFIKKILGDMQNKE